MKKLTAGQKSVLTHASKNEAVLIWSTVNRPGFWKDLPGASPSTFHSLVKRGLLEVKNNSFYFITPEGRAVLASGSGKGTPEA